MVPGGVPVPHAPVHIADAFAAARIYHQKRNRCAFEDQDLAVELSKIKDWLPKTSLIFGKSGNEKQTFEVDQQQLLWVLEHGFDAVLLELGEIRDMKSNVRIMTLPNQKPFGVFAREEIAAGTILHTVRRARTASTACRHQ